MVVIEIYDLTLTLKITVQCTFKTYTNNRFKMNQRQIFKIITIINCDVGWFIMAKLTPISIWNSNLQYQLVSRHLQLLK